MAEQFAHHPALVLVAVVFLGILAQVVAHRFHLPSILLLLIFGFGISPAGLNWINPDQFVDRDLMFAGIHLAVAVILFEGGLSLRFHELREIHGPLRQMITSAVVVTWFLAAAGAYFILQLPLNVSILIGAILVVTGPTVIGPLLRHVRPSGRVSSLIKWEGILNDPVGAVLAVLVLEVVLTGPVGAEQSVTEFALGIGLTVLMGLGLGVAAGWALAVALKNHWIPDFLEGVSALAMMLVIFGLSDLVQEESGLLTVTVMGIALANQRKAPVKHIVEFKEHLQVLFISCLFIVLAARLTEAKLAAIGVQAVIFVLLLIVVVRPAAVFLATARSDLSVKEKLFVCWMAPRGIVAAAVASLFSIKLTQNGIPGGEALEPVMFAVIFGTVGVYGLTAKPIAQALGVAQRSHQGVLIMGAHSWARRMAEAIKAVGFPVFLIDTNRRNVHEAWNQKLPAYHGNLLEEHAIDEPEVELDGIGRLLAITSNDEANSLGTVHLLEEFGRKDVYQLWTEPHDASTSGRLPAQYLTGQRLFYEGASYSALTDRFAHGATIEVVEVTEEQPFEAYQASQQGRVSPLFVANGRRLTVVTAGREADPEPGQTVLCLVDNPDASSS